MKIKNSVVRLAKFITYILGIKPDEFGLVPDVNGYVKIKELVKAVCEEDGFRYVRRSHLNEIVITLPNPPIMIRDTLIRAKNRDKLSRRVVAATLPKLLFTCVRNRAYPFVMEKGILPGGRQHVILSSEKQLAERIGKRSDSKPVLLTIHVRKTEQKGVLFQQMGDLIYLAKSIPTDCFTGPPLPKESLTLKKQENRTRKNRDAGEISPKTPMEPGSFRLNISEEQKTNRDQKGRKPARGSDWKRDKTKKQKRKRPPWRS